MCVNSKASGTQEMLCQVSQLPNIFILYIALILRLALHQKCLPDKEQESINLGMYPRLQNQKGTETGIKSACLSYPFCIIYLFKDRCVNMKQSIPVSAPYNVTAELTELPHVSPVYHGSNGICTGSHFDSGQTTQWSTCSLVFLQVEATFSIQPTAYLKNVSSRGGGTAQWLGALTYAPAEDQGLVPSTRVRQLTISFTSSFGGLSGLWYLWAPAGTC